MRLEKPPARRAGRAEATRRALTLREVADNGSREACGGLGLSGGRNGYTAYLWPGRDVPIGENRTHFARCRRYSSSSSSPCSSSRWRSWSPSRCWAASSTLELTKGQSHGLPLPNVVEEQIAPGWARELVMLVAPEIFIRCTMESLVARRLWIYRRAPRRPLEVPNVPSPVSPKLLR